MARSIDPSPAHPARGFVPAQNDEERCLMRHVEDMARAAAVRGIARYSAFLSDREQALAVAALNRAGAAPEEYRFDGGYPDAERRLLCIEPAGCRTGSSPLACVRLTCRASPDAPLPAHKDYLGSALGLELKREALGDIVLPPGQPGTAYVFALEHAAALIAAELCQVGRTEVSAEPQPLDALPELAAAAHETRTATVSSLRLDAVLAAMLHTSRTAAAELIAAQRVEINHLPAASAHAPVYEGDVFSVRGKGRFRLLSLPGKSKKDRDIIEYFQY